MQCRPLRMALIVGALLVGGGVDGAEYTIRFADDAIFFPERDGGFGSRFVAALNDAASEDEALLELLSRLGAVTFVPFAPHYRHLPERSYDRWGNEVQLVDMTHDYSVNFARALEQEELRDLNALPSVVYAAPTMQQEFYFTPDDDYFGDQWGLENTGQTLSFLLCEGNPDSTTAADHDVDATAAWDEVIAPGCKIGIIDSGVRQDHGDLQFAVDIDLSVSTDDCGHGTAVSGVAAASGNNGLGIAGIAHPDVAESDFPLVVQKNVQGCTLSEPLALGALALFANDFQYEEVRVVNESFGGGTPDKWGYSPAERDAHRNAYAQGLFIVAATGNENDCAYGSGDSCWVYPAAYNYFVTAVSGLDADGDNPLYPDRNFTDIAAASENIVTTYYGDVDSYRGYDILSPCGTSLAAPLVTGAGAMLLGANPDLTNDDIRTVLLRTADDLDPPGRDDAFGHGQLKLAAAIDYVSSPNKIYHGTTSSFSSTFVQTRSQDFANLPFSTTPDSFQTFVVDVYKLEVTASFAAKGVGETVIDVWGRPRRSDGLPNDDKIDAHLLTSYLEPDSSSFTGGSIKIYTYTYRVFAENDTINCLGWYPVVVPGQGACGSATTVPNFDFTFVTAPAGSRPGPGSRVGTPSLFAESVGGSAVRLIARGIQEVPALAFEFQIIDVTGRVVRTAMTHGDASATLPVDDLAAGVYLARVRVGGELATTKIHIVR